MNVPAPFRLHLKNTAPMPFCLSSIATPPRLQHPTYDVHSCFSLAFRLSIRLTPSIRNQHNTRGHLKHGEVFTIRVAVSIPSSMTVLLDSASILREHRGHDDGCLLPFEKRARAQGLHIHMLGIVQDTQVCAQWQHSDVALTAEQQLRGLRL